MRLSNLRYLLKEGAKNIWTNRTMSFASVAVVGFFLLLTGGGIFLFFNIYFGLSTVGGEKTI